MCTSVQVGQVSPVCVRLAHAVMWAQDYCRLHSATCTALQIIIIWGAEACSHVNGEVLFLKCEITQRCGWGRCSALTLRRQLDRWAFKLADPSWKALIWIAFSWSERCMHTQHPLGRKRLQPESWVVTKTGSYCELANDSGSGVDATNDTFDQNLAMFSHLKKSKERHWKHRLDFDRLNQTPEHLTTGALHLSCFEHCIWTRN